MDYLDSNRDIPQPSSFRGVPFFVNTETDVEFGRRIVEHNYPNSSRRYAEDTGGFAGRINISGFVVGSDALTQYNRLKSACNEPSPGELILVNLGSFTVKCGKCSGTSEPAKTVEKIDFTLEFIISDDTSDINAEKYIGDGCFSLSDDALSELEKYTNSNFGFSRFDFVTSLMTGDILSLIDSLRAFSDLVNFDDLPDFNRGLNILNRSPQAFLYNDNNNLGSILFGTNSPWQLVTMNAHNVGIDAVKQLIDTAYRYGNGLSIDPGKLSQHEIDVSMIHNWPETTKHRRDRNHYRNMLIHLQRLAALIAAYVTLANIDFKTTEEAISAINDIEYAYIELVHGQTNIKPHNKIPSPVVHNSYFLHEESGVRQSFERLRDYALRVVDSNANVLFRVTERLLLPHEETSVLNLAYLSQAESIKTEDDLLALMMQLSEENGAIFKCKGTVRLLQKNTGRFG